MDASAAHIEALRDRHQRLEAAIHEEQKHPMPDSIKIREMKKEKLHLKEQMSGIID